MDRAEQVGSRRWQGPLGVGLALALSWPLGAMAQTSGNTEAPKAGEVDRAKLTDAERARRDADRVFNFIKFHAVRPAAPATPAAPAAAARPPARPAAAAASPAPVAAAVAATPAATSAAAVPAAATGTSATPLGAAAPAAMAATEGSTVAAQAASTNPSAASAPGFDPRTLPPASPPPAVAAEPAPAAEPEPAEEVDLKMVKYVAPELDARAMSAVTTSTATVRVRFTVMPNGTVGSVTALPGTNRISASANRALGAVATRAVSQWRFEPVKEAREVEVNVDFRFD